MRRKWSLFQAQDRYYSLHYGYSRHFPQIDTIMGWKEVSAQELLVRAEAIACRQGAYQAEHRVKGNTKYVMKILKDQNWAFGRSDK